MHSSDCAEPDFTYRHICGKYGIGNTIHLGPVGFVESIKGHPRHDKVHLAIQRLSACTDHEAMYTTAVETRLDSNRCFLILISGRLEGRS